MVLILTGFLFAVKRLTFTEMRKTKKNQCTTTNAAMKTFYEEKNINIFAIYTNIPSVIGNP